MKSIDATVETKAQIDREKDFNWCDGWNKSPNRL